MVTRGRMVAQASHTWPHTATLCHIATTGLRTATHCHAMSMRPCRSHAVSTKIVLKPFFLIALPRPPRPETHEPCAPDTPCQTEESLRMVDNGPHTVTRVAPPLAFAVSTDAKALVLPPFSLACALHGRPLLPVNCQWLSTIVRCWRESREPAPSLYVGCKSGSTLSCRDAH